MIDLTEYIDFAKKIIKEAGKLTLKYFAKDLEIFTKEDNSPVTIADMETEKFIYKKILEKYPDHSIVGEEGTCQEKKSKFKWTVDPIDGTKVFLRDVPLYSNLLALLYEDEVVLGLIYCPYQNLLCYAFKGGGCFLNDLACKVSGESKLENALFCFTDLSSNFRRGYKDVMIKLIENCKYSRGWGDGYGYLLLACGKVDIMLDPKMSIWDLAPVKIIIEEAGGVFYDAKGESKELKNSALACSSEELFLAIKKNIL